MMRLIGFLIFGIVSLGAGALTTQGSTVDYADGVIIETPIILDSNDTELQVLSGSAEQAGDISEVNGPRPLAKTGDGTLTLSGESSYTGATTVRAGKLVAGSDTAFSAASDYSVEAGATLGLADEMNGDIGSLSGAGTVEIGSYSWFTVGENNASTTFSGSIQNTEEGSMTKTGSGTLTLTGSSSIGGFLELCGCSLQSNVTLDGGSFTAELGVNAFGGTLSVLNGGRLETVQLLVDGNVRISGENSILEANEIRVGIADPGSSILEVSHGGVVNAESIAIEINSVLKGDGTINGATTISEGSRISPGNSAGTITFTSGLMFEDGAILDLELGTVSDLIRVSGGLLSGSPDGEIVLNLTGLVGFEAGTYTFLDFTGAGLANLTADSFRLGSTIADFTFTIRLDGEQFQIVAEAVPEPSTYLLIGSAALLLIASRWRRMRQSHGPMTTMKAA